ncbi:hypothetical protein I9W82_001412 [Candida metapsilosis]|uniref:Uncharacterized protein n=1 Tax=Candida metapsilosis TaxID=273372 RepID=A0A8H8DE55_9ASCO|nr:hypothetical protein I9W82_001412 [Candida metapsilosis]
MSSSDKQQQQDNKEFGQLGDIAQKLQSSQAEGGGDGNIDKDLKAQAAEAYGKFEKLSDKEKEDLVKGGLGKLEGKGGEKK